MKLGDTYEKSTSFKQVLFKNSVNHHTFWISLKNNFCHWNSVTHMSNCVDKSTSLKRVLFKSSINHQTFLCRRLKNNFCRWNSVTHMCNCVDKSTSLKQVLFKNSINHHKFWIKAWRIIFVAETRWHIWVTVLTRVQVLSKCYLIIQ